MRAAATVTAVAAAALAASTPDPNAALSPAAGAGSDPGVFAPPAPAARTASTPTSGTASTLAASAEGAKPRPPWGADPTFIVQRRVAKGKAKVRLGKTVGTGFWRSSGLRGADAFGVYLRGSAGVRLSFLLKDLAKGRRTAAVRLTFTGRHHRSVRVVALPAGVAKQWRTVRSAYTRHLYVQECTGTWRKKRFRIGTCGARRRRY
jgi:hypothetical protein